MTTLTELINRWNTDEGKPYKGILIDMDAYNEDPTNPGCMCAQGQAMHLIGGWTPERLNFLGQSDADIETAKLLGISRAHAVLLRITNDKADGAPAVVLTDPGAILGDQWSKLLDFWWHLDGMSAAARAAASAAARDAARDAAEDAAWYAAEDAAVDAARDAAGAAAGGAAGGAARTAAWDAAGASNEIQGAEILRRNGKPFFFLPIFGFASPDEIPARPANYGEVSA